MKRIATDGPVNPARHGAEARTGLGAVLVLGAAALWATFGLFAKLLYERGYAPLELASIRAAVGFLAAAAWLVPRAAGRLRLRARELGFFAAYGVLGFALFETVFFMALARTTVAIAAALLYTAPAFVLLASRLLWHERIPPRKLLALGMVLAGVVLVTGALSTLAAGRSPLTPGAVLLGLGAGAGYALYTLFSKVATTRYGSDASLFWSFLFAAIALAFIAPPLEPLLRRPDTLPALIALGIVPTLIPYALYLAALHRLRASTAAMLASFEPVIAALLAAAVLGEALDGTRAVGVALIVGAAVLIAREDGAPAVEG
jgi:drug/metabolite transporter (DMT)-like permease